MNELFAWIIIGILGFSVGGWIGSVWLDGFSPACWVGLCVVWGLPICAHSCDFD